MRFPTLSQYRNQVNLMASQYERLSYLQEQSATGKKILNGRGAPLLADRIKAIQGHLQELDNYAANHPLAENRQHQKEVIANQTIDLTNRIAEIIQLALNGTLNDEDRQVLQREIKGIRTEFIQAVNSQDINHEYIFSGLNTQTQPYMSDSGNYIYQGTEETSQITLGKGVSVNYSEAGNLVFGRIPTGNGVFAACADLAANLGTGILAGGQVRDLSQYLAEDYTITMTTNSRGELAYSVFSEAGVQLIPPPPALVPEDTSAYVSGSDLVFRGVSVQLRGNPLPGDQFFVTPSDHSSIFTSLDSLIEALGTPLKNEKDLNAFKQNLDGLLQNFEQAGLHFRGYLQDFGQQGKVIDNQKALLESLHLSETTHLKDLSEADYTKVITALSQQNLALQVTQKIYMQILETRQYMLTKR